VVAVVCLAVLLTLTGCFPGLGMGAQQPTPILKTQASFSPDGTRIAFISTLSGKAQIYMANADGSGVRQLTTGSTNAQPAWSPDGTRILFASNRDKKDENEFELYVMNADGTDQKLISIEIPQAK